MFDCKCFRQCCCFEKSAFASSARLIVTMAGFDRSSDELHVQLPRTNQPTIAIAGQVTSTTSTTITLTNGAMELPDHIKLLGP